MNFRFLPILVAVLLIITINIIRFVGLETSPPGFHVDELGGAVTVNCLATEGIDGRGKPYPLFSDLNFGTPKPPTYIYPEALWVKVLGHSISSFRAFSAFVAVVTIIGLFFLANSLFGRMYGLSVALVASLSPWAWMFSRIAYEPILAPCFLVWGLYFFRRTSSSWRMALSGLFFSLAMYSYPPTRAQLPLLLFPLFIWSYSQAKIPLRNIVIFIVTLCAVSLPLVIKTFSGDLHTRFDLVGITSQEYLDSIHADKSLKTLSILFIINFLKHFNFNFWFGHGDQNIMHSSQFSGLFSWVETTAVFIGIGLLLLSVWKYCHSERSEESKNKSFALRLRMTPQTSFILFLIINILIGIMPAALTWEGLPHSLRILGAWPFVSLLTGFIIWKVYKRWPLSFAGFVLIGILFFTLFARHYFNIYPTKTYGMFSTWAKEDAIAAKTDEQWLKYFEKYRNDDFHIRYYLTLYRGQSCTKTANTYQNFIQLLNFLKTAQ